jgi:hypothetical protein
MSPAACSVLAPAAHQPVYLQWAWLFVAELGSGWHVQVASSSLMLVMWSYKRRATQPLEPHRRRQHASQCVHHSEVQPRSLLNDLDTQTLPGWFLSVRIFKRVAFVVLSCKPIASLLLELFEPHQLDAKTLIVRARTSTTHLMLCIFVRVCSFCSFFRQR